VSTSSSAGASARGPAEPEAASRFGKAREHLAVAQLELVKALRSALAAVEGAEGGTAAARAEGAELAGGAIGTLLGVVMRYAERVARRRESDARLKTMRTIRDVLATERRLVAQSEGASSPTLRGFDAVIRVLDREVGASAGSTPGSRRRSPASRAHVRAVPVD